MATELFPRSHLPVGRRHEAQPKARDDDSYAALADRRAKAYTGYGRAREEVKSLQSELVLVGIDDPLARRAGELAEEHELRSRGGATRDAEAD
jgi:hypothetical protein